jgi:ABC-2 type transport system permease protein
VARQWGKTAVLAGSSHLGENGLFLLDYLLRGLRVVVMLSIWRLLLEGDTDASMTLGAVLTYALLSEVFLAQLVLRTDLTEALWQGSIATHLVRPMGIVGQYAAPMVGRWGVDFALFSLPLLLLAPLLGVDPLPASGTALALFVVSLGLSISVGLALDFFFAALTVALEQTVWLIEYARSALTGLLSGVVIPLVLLPWGLGDVIELLPFASLAWAPLAIYTGAADASALLVRQALWSVVLWPVALWMWRAGREKLAAAGG